MSVLMIASCKEKYTQSYTVWYKTEENERKRLLSKHLGNTSSRWKIAGMASYIASDYATVQTPEILKKFIKHAREEELAE